LYCIDNPNRYDGGLKRSVSWLSQVWFQNRRSKDRRMKQLNALGARRQFFRGPHHRLRPLLLPAIADDILDAHNDIYAAPPPPTFAYFAGMTHCQLLLRWPRLAVSVM